VSPSATESKRLRNGIVNVSRPRTATTRHHDPGVRARLRRDLRRALEKNRTRRNRDFTRTTTPWGDENGLFPIFAGALVGTARSFPLAGGSMRIGEWQQIVLCDFDDRPGTVKSQ